MKRYFYWVALLCPFIFSCSDEEGIGVNTDETTCGNDIIMTIPFSAEGGIVMNAGTRADDGNNGMWDNSYIEQNSSNDWVPVGYYPGTTLYLIHEKIDGTVISSIPFTVNTQGTLGEEGYSQSVDVRFWYNTTDKTKLYVQALTSEGTPDPDKLLTLDVSTDEARIYFSSYNGLEYTLNDKVTVDGKEVYKPVGDVLFRSENRAVKIGEEGMLITPQPVEDSAEPADGSFVSLCENVPNIKLNRCTSIITPTILITSDRPLVTNVYALDNDGFKKEMGTDAKDWSFCFFMYYPLSYRMHSTHSVGAIGNVLMDGNKDNIALSQKRTNFEDGTISAGGEYFPGDESTSYTGVGGGDNSYPFLYWASSEYLTQAGAKLYVSIKDPNDVEKILAIDADFELKANEHRQI